MRCPSCQAENRANRRFCSACGAGLPAGCAGCGFVNEPGEKFCGGCGAALAGAPAAARPAPVPRQGERRLVTVLFADLAGYTRMTSQLDPEETQAILTRFFETVDGVVLAYGGTIDKHIGDNVMGIFGAPIAHDNDPERAVRAAVEIHRRVEELSDELPVALRVHIGIASGEVVASELGSSHHQEYTVTGDAVNLAARLQDKATAGETMVSDPVRRATEKVAVFEAVGELPIKGLADPVRVWKVVSLREERVAPRERGFVGRRSEMRQLHSVLAETLDSGRGAVIQVRGEAGIGKTRFVAEVCDQAQALGFACHTALVLDFGAGRGGALQPVLAELATVGAEPIDAGDAPFLADLLDQPAAEADRAGYAAMTVAAREEGKRRVAAQLVRAAAAAGPMLLVVEDIHWADPGTLRMLGALAAAAAGCPAVLLMTSRLEGDPLGPEWRGQTAGAPLVIVDLAPLRPEEALALATEVYSTSDDLVRTCIERAGGNPLFLEQLLENAREASAEGGLPATIQSLVLSRMDRLAATDKRTLQAAAVIGQRFTVEALRALTGDPGASCDALITHHLVGPTDEGYLFHHALIRDGVYSSLTRARRAELHRAAAAWYGDGDPVLRAQHLDRAEDGGAALAYLAAARAEADLLHSDAAAALAARGRALATGPAERHALASLQGRIARDLGEGSAMSAAYTDALAHAPDDGERCRAWIGVAAGHRLLSDYPPAFRALDQAEPLARRLDLARELAQIHYHRGSLYFTAGGEAKSRAEHERALAEARRAGDRELEARAMSGLGDAEFFVGDMHAAAERFEACLHICEQLGLERFAIPNRCMLGETRFWHGNIKEGQRQWDLAAAAAERLGDRYACILLNMQRAFQEVATGSTEQARRCADLTREMAIRLGATRYVIEVDALSCEILVIEGQRERALEVARASVAMARRQSSMTFSGPLSLGALRWLSPDPDERRQARVEFEAIAATGTMMLNHAMFHRWSLEGALERHDWDEAQHHIEALKQALRDEETVYGYSIGRGRLLVHWGRGRRDAALITQLHDVLARARRLSVIVHLPPDLLALAG